MSLDSGSQIITSEPATVPNAGPSFHRASIHFAASLTAPSSEQALCGPTHDTMVATSTADDMKRRIEFVAQAIHDAEPSAFAWDAEPAFDRERYREYARNAIKLLGEEIGVLLFSLGEVAAEQHVS